MQSAATVATLPVNLFNWQVNQVRIVDRFKPSIISSLCIACANWFPADWMDEISYRSNGHEISVTNCCKSIRSMIWHLEVLVIYCSLEVSGSYDSTCHQIKTTQAWESGITRVQQFSHLKFFPHRSVLKIHPDTLITR